VDKHFRVPIYDRERSLLDCFATPRHFGCLSEALGILEEHAGELDLEKLCTRCATSRRLSPSDSAGRSTGWARPAA
jgi:predicted transcriptional regulator of viral defense system